MRLLSAFGPAALSLAFATCIGCSVDAAEESDASDSAVSGSGGAARDRAAPTETAKPPRSRAATLEELRVALYDAYLEAEQEADPFPEVKFGESGEAEVIALKLVGDIRPGSRAYVWPLEPNTKATARLKTALEQVMNDEFTSVAMVGVPNRPNVDTFFGVRTAAYSYRPLVKCAIPIPTGPPPWPSFLDRCTLLTK